MAWGMIARHVMAWGVAWPRSWWVAVVTVHPIAVSIVSLNVDLGRIQPESKCTVIGLGFRTNRGVLDW